MFKRILALTLMLISASAFSAVVTVNGKSCGSLTTLSLSADNQLMIQTDTDCTTVVTPPPPPVVDPFSCPQGVTCQDLPFPTISQRLVTVRGGQVLAYRIKTGASGSGTVNTMVYAGVTATRLVSFSTLPGEMSTTRYCSASGLEVTTNRWEVAGANSRVCQLPANKDVWLNIKATNCPDGASCRFYLKGN